MSIGLKGFYQSVLRSRRWIAPCLLHEFWFAVRVAILKLTVASVQMHVVKAFKKRQGGGQGLGHSAGGKEPSDWP